MMPRCVFRMQQVLSGRMGSGKPARDTSIRPHATPLEERGGCDIAEFEKVEITASCELLRLRQDHQDLAEVKGVDDKEKVGGEEEITAPDETRKRQNQFSAFRPQIHLLSVMCWHFALLITPTDFGVPTVLRDEVVSLDISHVSPARAGAYPLCRSTIAS